MEEDCGGAVAALVELFVYGFFEFRLQAFDYFAEVRKKVQELDLFLEFDLACFGCHFFEFLDLLNRAFLFGCGVD